MIRRLIEAIHTGDKSMRNKLMGSLLFITIYFMLPIDIIADAIPILGVVDDMLMLLVVDFINGK